jgi:hypothetical protein
MVEVCYIFFSSRRTQSQLPAFRVHQKIDFKNKEAGRLGMDKKKLIDKGNEKIPWVISGGAS